MEREGEQQRFGWLPLLLRHSQNFGAPRERNRLGIWSQKQTVNAKEGLEVHTRAQMSQRKMQSGLVIPKKEKSQLHLGDLGAWKRLESESLQKLRTCWDSRCVRRHFCAEFADYTYMCCCNPPPRAQCRSWLKTEAECGKLWSETDASARPPASCLGAFHFMPLLLLSCFQNSAGAFHAFWLLHILFDNKPHKMSHNLFQYIHVTLP